MGTKFVTMGEIMVRLTRPRYQRNVQGSSFDNFFGGSEANVAVSLATMGDEVEYITRLPENQMGIACRNELRRYNVGTHHIIWGGKRLGSYYFEQAVSVRGSSVVYDRAGSAMAELEPSMVNWGPIFDDAQVFHWSGISCAISQASADATLAGLDEALRRGLFTSLDINYRKNLWNYGKEAREVLFPAARKCKFIFGDTNEWPLLTGLQIPPFKATDSSYQMDIEGYRTFFEKAQEMLPDTPYMFMGMRHQVDANHHLLTGLLWADGQLYQAPIMDIENVIDPIGVGDAFCAAYLHARFRWPDQPQRHLNYALTASSLKNTVRGDFNLVTEEEVIEAMKQLGLGVRG